jgi:hypothetical protein
MTSGRSATRATRTRKSAPNSQAMVGPVADDGIVNAPMCGQVHVTDNPCTLYSSYIVAWAYDGSLRYPSVHYACPQHSLEVYKHVMRGDWSRGVKPRWLFRQWIGEPIQLSSPSPT